MDMRKIFKMTFGKTKEKSTSKREDAVFYDALYVANLRKHNALYGKRDIR